MQSYAVTLPCSLLCPAVALRATAAAGVSMSTVARAGLQWLRLDRGMDLETAGDGHVPATLRTRASPAVSPANTGLGGLSRGKHPHAASLTPIMDVVRRSQLDSRHLPCVDLGLSLSSIVSPPAARACRRQESAWNRLLDVSYAGWDRIMPWDVSYTPLDAVRARTR